MWLFPAVRWPPFGASLYNQQELQIFSSTSCWWVSVLLRWRMLYTVEGLRVRRSGAIKQRQLEESARGARARNPSVMYGWINLFGANLPIDSQSRREHRTYVTCQWITAWLRHFFKMLFLLKMTKVSNRALIKRQIWGDKGAGGSFITIKSLYGTT